MRIISCGITDVGLKRLDNEDNYLINEELNLFVVADGMGGHAGGEYASAIAVNTIEEVITSIDSDQSATDTSDPVERNRHKITHAIRLAGRRIFEKAEEQPEYNGMGTTTVALVIDGGNAFIAHVGDSRLYMLRDSRLEQVTEDHSLIAEQLRLGRITSDQAKNHKMRNVITRSLGYQADVEVDLTVRAIRKGDQFLLCSDGLSGHVEDPEMEQHLLNYRPQEAARRLVELACERGGEDNITVIIARVEET